MHLHARVLQTAALGSRHRSPVHPACPLLSQAHRATHFLDFAGIEDAGGVQADVEDHFA